MSAIDDIIEKLSDTKTIDISDLGIEGLTQLQYQVVTAQDMVALYGHEAYRAVQGQEAKNMVYSQLVVWLMLNKADPSVTFSSVQKLPIDILNKIVQRLAPFIDNTSQEIKN